MQYLSEHTEEDIENERGLEMLIKDFRSRNVHLKKTRRVPDCESKFFPACFVRTKGIRKISFITWNFQVF
jgi:hypothetical protein